MSYFLYGAWITVQKDQSSPEGAIVIPADIHFIGWSTDKPAILNNKRVIQKSGSIVKIQEHVVNLALLIIDMQNGFVSKGGPYDLRYIKVSCNSSQYSTLIRTYRKAKIPIFFTQAVREGSGIDLLMLNIDASYRTVQLIK